MKPLLTAILLSVVCALQAQNVSVGTSIYGDFNGDGVKEYAFAVQTQQGIGNAVEDGVPGLYALYFSDARIPEVSLGCCEIRLVNEGDLNGDGADDISIYQSPMNGNTFTMTTLAYSDTSWVTIVPSFFIATVGTPLTDQELADRVYAKEGVIYYRDVDANDERQKLIERRVRL